VTLAGQFLRLLMQLASVVILARLLSPADYGLIAVVLVLVGVGEIFRDAGLSTAAIRAPQLSRDQRDGLFWVNSAIGVVLAMVTFAVADPLAAALSQPALEPITQVLALTFLFTGMATQYRADLTRRLHFGSLVVADVAAQFISLGVAIVAAAMGAGYWALVAQQLVQVAVVLIVTVVAARWIPGLPRRRAGLGPFLRLGGSLMGTQLVHYLGNNVDTITLAWRSGPVALGLYNRSFQLVMTPLNQIRTPATTVAVPVLARVQHDDARFGEYIRRGQLALGFTLVAGLAIAAGAATPLVEVMLGDEWAEAAPVLALLAIAGGAQTLAFVGYWVYLSRGLGSALLRYTLATFVLKAACITVGSAGGLVGVAAGYMTAALIEWPISLWRLSRITRIPVRELYLGASRVTLCATAAGTVSLVITELTESFPATVNLSFSAIAGLSTYGIIAALIPKIRSDLRGVADWAGRMFARK
jgi:PST family polysaccharide transporter